MPVHPQNADRLVERYTVVQQIARCRLIIPFELEHAQYLEGLTYQFSGGAKAQLLRSPLQRPVGPSDA